MRFAFFSTMGGSPWGGSEELWSRAATVLRRASHEVAFSTLRWPAPPAPLRQLEALGSKAHFRRRAPFGRTVRQALERVRLLRWPSADWLRDVRPDLVLVSLSLSTDDPQIAATCRKLGIPYALLLQAAGECDAIAPRWIDRYREAYANAERCYFVSAENRAIVEASLALDLPQAEIVDNPFQVRPDAAPSWPAAERAWKLACVARIHTPSKGQDVLLRVLKQPKWRERPLEVVLWGNDQGSLAHVRRLIALYGLEKQVTYGGFARDVEALWSEHHALVLPSRVEGSALALVEAMLCGRMPIVTGVGRAAELVDDNRSGFIAAAAAVPLVDDALERAWQRRHEWQTIGRRAAETIRARHSLAPAEDFADRLVALASTSRSAARSAA